MRDLDAFLLRAVIEAALRQGDLRLELEKTLGRTLWWASAPEGRREALLDAAGERAEALRSPVVPWGWNRVIYRTGLDRGACNALRARLGQLDSSEIRSLADSVEMCLEESELILQQLAVVATNVTPVEQSWPSDLDSEQQRETIVRFWLSGAAPELSDSRSLDKAFEYLGRYAPWIVGASIEILRWMYELDSSQLSRIHTNLGLDRLRFGVPSSDAANVVARGLPRSEAADLWHRYRASRAPVSFLSYVTQELESDTAELLGLHEPLDEPEPSEWLAAEQALLTDPWDPMTVTPF